MLLESYLIAGLFTTIIVSFVWARFWFFESSTDGSKLALTLYDPAVVLHVGGTLYGLVLIEDLSVFRFLTALICMGSGGILFLWTLRSADSKKLVFNNEIDHLMTTGAYGFVRHPFYLSYSLVWFGSVIATNLPPLLITLVYLTAFYYKSALTEERALIRSTYSEEYGKYRNEVGMFFPRIKSWIS
ncbi:MAG: isoprenylcysteine carboxylmethyltransferase family protein [Pseudomonadales bacterium]|nr:isoprenylcysteine carboxylmethyltransferase family protein [Pseudomonadales bacterium]